MKRQLTKSQELFWTGQALAGDVPLYNQAWRFDLIGPLSPSHFTQAFDRLVERTDVLRTVFRETTNGISQDVLAETPKPLDHINLSSMTDPDEQAQSYIEARSRKPFDLGRASYDAALLKLGDNHQVFFFSQHHIVTDAWSVAVLFEALCEHLKALRSGLAMPSDPLPVFQNFVLEEQRFRASDEGQTAADHWRRIAESSAGLPRLYNRRNTEASTETVRLVRALTDSQVERLSLLSQTDGVRSFSIHLTRFNLFVTALFAYVARVTDQRKITIGTPAHNRSTLLLKRLPGLLVEVFPFVAELDEGETFHTLYDKVAAANMERMRFSQAGAVSAESARSFNIILNYINVAFPEVSGLTRRVEWLSTGAMDPGHDMRLHVMDMNGDGVPVLAMDLKCGVFSEPLRSNILDHVLVVLDAMLDNFDQPIDAVPIVTESERVAHLETYNRAASAGVSEETVLSLFTKVVSSSADMPAVIFGEETLTFAAMNDWSDAIAAELTAMGVRPGAIVGVHMRRSME